MMSKNLYVMWDSEVRGKSAADERSDDNVPPISLQKYPIPNKLLPFASLIIVLYPPLVRL